jgi:Lrp/AsnC family leucine-responsive transcriptional regulator
MSDGDQKAGELRLTEVDRAILAKLEQNSRRSISELAASLHISRAHARDRMTLMRERGVIRRFTVDLGRPPKQELNCGSAFFQLRLKRPVCRIVYATISGWPELMGCWSIAGELDMVVLISARSNFEIETLRDRLSRHPEVKTLTTLTILREWTNDLDDRNANIVGERFSLQNFAVARDRDANKNL